MDNQAKIYTLYFVFEEFLIFLENLVKNGGNSKDDLARDKLFDKFLTQAQKQYSDLQYDLVCEIGLANYKAEQEFGRLASRIKTFLGDVENINNFPLVFTLWIALNLALSFYASMGEAQPNWIYDLEEQLRLGHQKYLSASQSNSEEWQQTDYSIIKLKRGNF